MTILYLMMVIWQCNHNQDKKPPMQRLPQEQPRDSLKGLLESSQPMKMLKQRWPWMIPKRVTHPPQEYKGETWKRSMMTSMPKQPTPANILQCSVSAKQPQ